MKTFTLSLTLIILVQFVHAQKEKGKKIYLQKAGDNGVMIFSNQVSCQPGDTIVLRSSDNPFSYVYLNGFVGTAQKPIVVINEGGVAILKAGFDIENCRFLKITGSGTKDRYGFSESGGTGISIHGKASDIEAERFYVKDAAFGCWVKNEANCDTSINNWVLDNISIHDYEMHNIGIEGFYLGSTDANNATRPINCGGKQMFHKPSKLGNIKIYNGIINGTGRPAIMLSNAQVGMSEIYNNKITNVGREFNDQQGTGISLGLYTRAYVHHNTIKNTYTWGIASLGGSGLVRIEDNTVDSSGHLDGKFLNWPQNIVVDTRNTLPVDSTKFIIKNNKVSSPGKDVANIEVWQTVPSYAAGGIICGNTFKGKPALVRTDPKVKFNACGEKAASSEKKSSALLYIIGGTGVAGLLYFLLRKKENYQAVSVT